MFILLLLGVFVFWFVAALYRGLIAANVGNRKSDEKLRRESWIFAGCVLGVSALVAVIASLTNTPVGSTGQAAPVTPAPKSEYQLLMEESKKPAPPPPPPPGVAAENSGSLSSFNGRWWKSASAVEKSVMCDQLARQSKYGNSSAFFQSALDNFYATTDSSVLSTAVEDAARLMDSGSRALPRSMRD